MMAANDLELLDEYARAGSEEAFAELVRRHLDLVYSAALRQVRSPQLAEEVAQSVFTDLSRSARRLKSDTVLSAWLYQAARRTGVDVVRRESRRQLRERLALELNDMNACPSIWTQIEPLLEEAMEQLDPAERSAILLRFFENRSLREVGQTLGTSEDAAQKRVSRAVESLREIFAHRGVTAGASGLALALSANAVQSAPLGLATAISTGATISGALHTVATFGTTKALAMTTLQKIIITAALAAAAGAGLYESRQVSQARDQLRAVQQRQEPLNEQVRQLAQERDAAARQLAALQQENDSLRGNLADLPRLRGEVGRLRGDSRELAQIKTAATNASADPALDAAFKTWAVRATRLRQRLDLATDQQIPELQLLTEKDWFDAVKGLKQLETDDDYRAAYSKLRNIAKDEFGNALRSALRAFTDANNGQLPQDLAQLKPFFDRPVDDAMLQRYKLLQTGKLSDITDQYLVGEIAPPLDPDHDARYEFSLNGTHSESGSPVEKAVEDAGIQFAMAHDGSLPTEPSQLAPYLKQPIDPQKVQTILSKIPPGVTTLQQLKAVTK